MWCDCEEAKRQGLSAMARSTFFAVSQYVTCCAYCDKVLQGVCYEPPRLWTVWPELGIYPPRQEGRRECSGPLPGGRDVAVVKEAGKTKFVQGPLVED